MFIIIVRCTYEKYWKHLRFHQNDSDFIVQCSVHSCKKSFKKIHSFYKHLKKKNSIFYKEQFCKRSTSFGSMKETHIRNESNNLFDGDSNVTFSEEIDSSESVLEIDMADYISTFLLELRESKKVSGEACTFVCLQMAKLVRIVWDRR